MTNIAGSSSPIQSYTSPAPTNTNRAECTSSLGVDLGNAETNPKGNFFQRVSEFFQDMKSKVGPCLSYMKDAAMKTGAFLAGAVGAFLSHTHLDLSVGDGDILKTGLDVILDAFFK